MHLFYPTLFYTQVFLYHFMYYTQISYYLSKFRFPSACLDCDGLLQGDYSVMSNVQLTNFVDCRQ
jgi:hypothetical protein